MKLKRKLKFCWKLTSVGITTTTAQKYRLAANKLTTCVFLLLLFCHTLFRTHTHTNPQLPSYSYWQFKFSAAYFEGRLLVIFAKIYATILHKHQPPRLPPLHTHTHTWKAILKRRLTWSRNWFNISKRLSEGVRGRRSVRGKKQRTSKLKANRISWQLLMKAACKATKRVAHTQPCRCPPLHLPPTPPAGATHSGIL